MPETVGFIGLGTMGRPMCLRLIEAGYEVTAYDISEPALEIVTEYGARPARSGVECAREADVLFTSLRRPEHVSLLMAGESGVLSVMREGSIWVDLTTNDLSLLQSMAADAPEGVSVCDAPVTGAVDGARNGMLTLFIGGEGAAQARVTPILRHLGMVIRCGPLGTGNVVKLVTNQLWFIHAAAIGEGFALGMANGVDLSTLWHAIKQSVGDSFVARHDAPSIFAGHYDPSFALDLCLKDLGLLETLADNVDAELSMTNQAHEVFRKAADRYGLDAGEMHVARQIEDDAGLTMQLEGDWTPPWEA